MGVYIKLGTNHPVAYCTYHKATLSKKQMNIKECLEKHCRYCQLTAKSKKSENKRKIAKENRRKKKIRKQQYFRMIDTRKLMRRIEYCNNCPTSKEEQVEYCALCPYVNTCLSGMIQDFYEYLQMYERGNRKKLERVFIK